MEVQEGSFRESKRKLMGSSIVHSPSVVKESVRRPNRTGSILKSMQLLDDAIPSVTPILPALSKSRGNQYGSSTMNMSKSFRGGLSFSEDKNSSVLSNTFLEFDAGKSLLEPKTPTNFQRQEKNVKYDMEKTPYETVTTSLYIDFRQNLCQCESTMDVFTLVDSFEEVCKEHSDLLQKLFTPQIHFEEESFTSLKKMLKNEKQTWRLVSCIYKDIHAFRDRQSTSTSDQEMAIDKPNQVLSEREAIEKYFEQNSDIRQAQIVIDWLEQNAADDLQDVTADQLQHYTGLVSWENSLHKLKMRKDSSTLGHCLTEMDPDAPTRTRKALDDLDNEDENRLLKFIFTCIRAGKIDQAQDLCLSHGQAWRAASLEGWKLYHDPNFRKAPSDKERASLEGNPHRRLWKIASWAMSVNKAYCDMERAIYGSLCGNLKSMLAVCSSWEDCLWAYYKTMVDLATEQRLQQIPIQLLPWQHVMGSPLPVPDDYWTQRIDHSEQIFERMDTSYDQTVRDEGNRPYHIIQKCLILGNTALLTEELSGWVDGINPHLFRFITHLVLFLKSLGLPMSEEHADTIVEAYVKLLVQNETTSRLAATYAAFLPKQLQISCYASFLETIDDPAQRREFLQLAEEAGLDIPSITKTVVERIRAQGEPVLANLTLIGAEVNDENPVVETPVVSIDRKKIDAIDWLIFDPSQRCEALKQSNAVARTFLASRKFAAAKELFMKIPDNSIDIIYREWGRKADSSVSLPAEQENTIKEHLCLEAYLTAQTAFCDWFRRYHSKPATPDSMETTSLYHSVSMSDVVAEEHRQKKFEDEVRLWSERLQLLCDSVSNKIYNVLLFPQGWLVDLAEEGNTEELVCRQHQLTLLRQVCIPSLCNLLVTVFTCTDGRSKDCVKLANVLASESHKLYELFTKPVGKKLLRRIQDAMLDV